MQASALVAPDDRDDPGWGRPREILLGVFLPSMAMRREHEDRLVALRTIFVAFVTALLLIGVVSVLLVAGEEPTDGVAAITGVVAAVGAGSQLVGWRLGRLDCTSPEALADSYRQRFFLRLAALNAGALAAFTGTFLAHSVVPYAVGAAIALVGYLRLAPTTGRLRRDEARLQVDGCHVSLVQALRSR